ncbi:MAG: GNAT family N-acetyltransferase [Actinobacteria bacterium]|nr:GNAT family N-acetyltransferase [Actinomycetota bacterium]
MKLIDAELADPGQLAEALKARLPHDWPPEHHDVDLLYRMRTALDEPDAAGWWLHYIVSRAAPRLTLVGTAGYKGPPVGGIVEIGYSIVSSRRRQGLATEACKLLVESAWERGAETVVADTVPHLKPSIGVLRKLGFESSESPAHGVLRFTLRRV